VQSNQFYFDQDLIRIHAVRLPTLLQVEKLIANSMDPDQTARMRRLVWIHAGCKPIMLVLSWRGSYIMLWRMLKYRFILFTASPIKVAFISGVVVGFAAGCLTMTCKDKLWDTLSGTVLSFFLLHILDSLNC
jgi:hypothetical protein